jgi:hypothetical protein
VRGYACEIDYDGNSISLEAIALIHHFLGIPAQGTCRAGTEPRLNFSSGRQILPRQVKSTCYPENYSGESILRTRASSSKCHTAMLELIFNWRSGQGGHSVRRRADDIDYSRKRSFDLRSDS